MRPGSARGCPEHGRYERPRSPYLNASDQETYPPELDAKKYKHFAEGEGSGGRVDVLRLCGFAMSAGLQGMPRSESASGSVAVVRLCGPATTTGLQGALRTDGAYKYKDSGMVDSQLGIAGPATTTSKVKATTSIG
jgi:hypothetical protein